MRTASNRSQNGGGYSLIEAMLVVALIAILVAASLPYFGPASARNTLRAAAGQLRSDLQEARTQAMQRAQPVYLRFWRSADGRDWCWGQSSQSGCDCRLPADAAIGACRIDSQSSPRTVSSIDYRGVALESLPFGGELRLSPVRADLVAGNVSFGAGATGPSVRVVVSALGRVRLCSPAGARALNGLPAC